MKKILACIVSVMLLSGNAFAGEVGIVTYIEGRVDASRANSEMAMPIREGDTISVGDAIRTKSNSKVELRFNDKTVLRLAQNTKVKISDYELDKDNRRKTATVRLDRGKARAIIAKMPQAADFTIATPNAQGVVKGSDIFAFYQAGNSGMLVADGRLAVINTAHPETSITIPAGNSVLVPLEELPRGPRQYFDLEKKLHEQDTNCPVVKRGREGIIKGVVTKVSGDVRVLTKGQDAHHACSVNEVISEGDRIETYDNGLVEIKFDNGNAINLKPNTNLLMGRLVFDPATGEYENLFESTAGKVKCRIENLKGKSRFEVKTPIAISGARGTIMYLEITATMIRSFFEGGEGYVKNMISDLEKTVAAGANAYADNKGVVSDPVATPYGERLEWGEGWEPGSGTEGYSSPEGSVGVYLSTDDTGTVGMVGRAGGEEAPETDGIDYFSDLPFTPDTTTTITEVIENVTSSGALDGSASYYGSSNGAFDGLIGLVDSFWNGLSASFLSAGDLSTDGRSPFIWYSGGDSLYSNDPVTDNHMTYDGGSFYGIAGGIGGSDILEGAAAMIYIDPSGNAGLAEGDLFGIYSGDLSTYLLGGTITGTQMPDDRNIGVGPDDLYDSIWKNEGDGYLTGSFGAGGDIGGEENLLTISLVNHDTDTAQTWGVYGQTLGGSFVNPEGDNSWSAHVGGNDSFGAYLYNGEEAPLFRDDEGYWIADITNGSWEDDVLSGDSIGDFITKTKMGTLDGRLIGTYNDDGEWQAVGLGTWEGAPLTLSGYVNYGFYDDYPSDNLFNDDGEGVLEPVGYIAGLIGSAIPSWWNQNSFPFIVLGEYHIGEYRAIEPFIWNAPLQSSAFYGFTAGIWNGQEMDGAIASLYIDPAGNAGVLRGGLSGSYYSGLSMWNAGGELKAIQMESGFNPEYFSIYEEPIKEPIDDNLGLFGSFNGTGSIAGYQSSGYTYSLSEDKRWGIFDIKLADENYYEDKPEGETGWSAVMGGNDNNEYGMSYWLTNIEGTWGDDEIRALVKGSILSDSSLGAIEGDLFGVNSEDYGTWIAAIVGSWAEEELTFSGRWGDDSLYYNRNGSLRQAGSEDGLVGAVTPDWWNQRSFPFLAMGEYSYRGGVSESTPKIWNTAMQSYESQGAFFGYTAGIWNKAAMDGAAAGIYIDPDVNAGVMIGDLSGNYYSGLSMWKAEGELIPQELGLDLNIDPEDLGYYTETGSLDAYVFGDFGDAAGESYINGWSAWGNTCFIIDEDGNSQQWGIYNIKLEGPDSYYNPEGSKMWAGMIEGAGQFGYNSSQGIMRGSLFGLYDEEEGPNEGYWIGTSVGTWRPYNVDVGGGIIGDEGPTEGEGAYYGFIGGIWENELIVGGLAALYVQPFEGYWEGILKWDELSGSGSGLFMGGGNISVEDVSGDVVSIIDQPWGIWGVSVNGNYAEPTSAWKLTLAGENSSEDYTSSYWLGTLNGRQWAGGRLEGDFRGFSFAPKEDGNIGGTVSTGRFVGTYIDVDEEGVGTWEAVGVGEWVEVTELLDPDQLGFDLTELGDFVNVPITEVYSSVMTGPGSFNAGVGSITGNMDVSLYADPTPPFDNGIWAAIVIGAYAGMPSEVSSWALNVANGSDNAVLTGTQWSDNQWAANVSGTVGGNSISGQAAGTYSGTDSGTFSGVGAGTWTEE